MASLREEIASLKAENITKRETLMTKERSWRNAAASCKELDGMIKFKDEADALRDILWKKELEELKVGKETIEASRSQAQIAWDQHEKVSSELAAVRGELEKALADLQEETRKSTLYRLEINNVLL